MTNLWQKCRISNLKYLLLLNAHNGHSFNDPDHYPVVPCVISNFTAPNLNLANQSIFRDFTRRRPIVDSCRFFLVRMEPFARRHCQRNRGVFDRPDDLFHSIPIACSRADSPELTPEFFSNPEFLLNTNKFEPLADVELPKWATSAVDFVYKQRMALESDVVSSRLHVWINSVWGLMPPPRGSPQLLKRRQLPKVEMPRNVRALSLDGPKVWFVDWLDNFACVDLLSRGPRGLELPGERLPPEHGPGLAAASRSTICCVHRDGRVRVHSDGAGGWAADRAEVVAMHCDWPVLAWINASMRLRVYDVRDMTRTFSRLVPCTDVTCLCASAACNVVVCGTKGGVLYVYTRAWARQLDVKFGGKPVRMLVTDGWGFIVVLVKRVAVGFLLRVLTANGMDVAARMLECGVRCWAAWTSVAGFDYIAFCDDRNRVFACEVYFCNIEAPLLRCQCRAVGIGYWADEEVIVVVLESGAIVYVPFTAPNPERRISSAR
jgi:hypothetical protein